MLDNVGLRETLLADRGCDSDALGQTLALADRGASANVKSMPGRVNGPVFSDSPVAPSAGPPSFYGSKSRDPSDENYGHHPYVDAASPIERGNFEPHPNIRKHHALH